MLHTIELVSKETVNLQRWEQCLAKNNFATLYTNINYLNTIADNWLGFTNKHYDFAFAVPIKKKYGITYAYTPPFIQQQCIHGNITEAEKKAIVALLKTKIKYGSIAASNNFEIGKTIAQKTNFILSLNQPFNKIYHQFGDDLKRNIEKANKHSFIYSNADVPTAIRCYQQINGIKTRNVERLHYARIKTFCDLYPSVVITRKITNANNDTLAIALCIRYQQRIYNLLNTTLPAGKQVSANHLLLTKIVEEFSENNLYFDFEGSDLPGIKNFYKGFNPFEETYTISRFNHLPFPLSLLP